LTNIKAEIKQAEVEHHARIQELERALLEQRMKLQVEAEEKIKQMEDAAEQKAAIYLQDHSENLRVENIELQKELAKLTLKTQRISIRKEQLEKENSELEREQKLRIDMIESRMLQIKNAELCEIERITKKKENEAKQRLSFMGKFIGSRTGPNVEKNAILAVDWDNVESDDEFQE
jgi:Fe2+ transport system protein FeoA